MSVCQLSGNTLNFLRLGNSAWDILRVNCWSRDFFLDCDFCPHLIIPVT